MSTTPARRAELIVAALVVTLGTLSASWREVSDWDVWWQLRIAHDALASGSVLPADTFSYSAAGTAWPHKDLVGYLVLYAGWAAAGYAGVALVLAATLLVGAAAWWFAVEPRHRDPAVWAMGSLVWIAAVQARVMPRAQVFSIALFVVMLALLAWWRRRDRDGGGALLPASLAVGLVCVWMNLHRGGVHGLVLLLGFACWGTLAAITNRLAPRAVAVVGAPLAPRSLLAAWIAVPLAIAAGALNPSGVAVYTTAFAVSFDPVHRLLISEWQPVNLDSLRALFAVAAAVVAVGIGATLVALARAARGERGPADLWHLGVAAVFARQGFSSGRWMSDAASSALAPLVALASAGVAAARSRDAWRGGPAFVAAVGLALAGLGHLTHHARLGLGPEEHRYPVAAIDFAREAELGARVHNSFVYGGPLVWFGRDRFLSLVDGRNDMVFASEFFVRCSRAQSDPAGFAALWAEHPGDWVLADNTPGRESFAFLARDPAWAMVFWSEEAVVYVPRAEAESRGLRPYSVLVPGAEVQALAAALTGAANDPAALERVGAELLRANTEAGGAGLDPASFRIGALLAIWLHAHGPARRAERDAVLDALMARWPEHPALPGLIAGVAR